MPPRCSRVGGLCSCLAEVKGVRGRGEKVDEKLLGLIADSTN